MTPTILVDIARDTTLIKGIYDACDLWCMYCTVTDRCLLFRSRLQLMPTCAGATADTRNQPVPGGSGAQVVDGLGLLRGLAVAEGRLAPIEVDAFLSNDRRKKTYLFTLDDPLERLGGHYMNLSDAYLHSRPDFPFEKAPQASGATPLEVFAWFHDLVPARIFRAILSAGAAAAGLDDRRNDALVAAKIALVGIDRSLVALTAMAAQDDDPRLELMHAHLNALRCGVEGRFPDARSFVRPGLDAPSKER